MNEKERLLKILSELDPTKEEYCIAVKNYAVLCEANNKRTLKDELIPILVGGVFTMLEIVMILRFERFDIISTKALAFVRKVF